MNPVTHFGSSINRDLIEGRVVEFKGDLRAALKEKQSENDIHEYADGWISERKGTGVPSQWMAYVF